MSAERFFDDLARTLAEPMPRRRAVRVISASLVALAAGGVSPRAARAMSRSTVGTCPPGSGRRQCFTTPDWKPGRPDAEPYCCPFPSQQWACGDKDNAYKCKNQCPAVNGVLKNPDGTPQRQQPTWSAATYQDGSPRRYNCCPIPLTIGSDGECILNCKATSPKSVQCGKNYCCAAGSRCKNPRTGECAPCPRGQQGCGSTCCARGEECKDCIENEAFLVTAPSTRTKCCAKNKKCCGTKCCEKNELCCGSNCCNGLKEACGRLSGRDTCCPDGRWTIIRPNLGVGMILCCPRGTVAVKGKGCCPPGQPDCCPPRDNLGGVLNCSGRGQVCVNGNCVNP